MPRRRNRKSKRPDDSNPNSSLNPNSSDDLPNQMRRLNVDGPVDDLVEIHSPVTQFLLVLDHIMQVMRRSSIEDLKTLGVENPQSFFDNPNAIWEIWEDEECNKQVNHSAASIDENKGSGAQDYLTMNY